MNLIAVLPFCKKDIDRARDLLMWIAQIEGCPRHACLLVIDSDISKDDAAEMKKLAADAFGHAYGMIARVSGAKTYVQACNQMFASAAHQILHAYRWPFLWLEPDCVPLKIGWLDLLAAEYDRSPRRYMGPIIESAGAVSAPADITRHMAAVSVYPNNAITDLLEFCKGDRCWDLAAHEFTVPRATDTRLIHHFWPGPDNLITFVAERTDEDPVNVRTLKSIRPEAVLFHQCKDDSLIKVLRAKLPPHDLSPDIRKMRDAK